MLSSTMEKNISHGPPILLYSDDLIIMSHKTAVELTHIMDASITFVKKMKALKKCNLKKASNDGNQI
jgi:hypothetical protein